MDKIIESTIKKLETVAIDPHPTLNPTLGIIYRADDAAAGSYLRSITRNADKYKSTTISVKCDTIQDASLQIRRWSQDPNINGIILISDYGEATQSLYNMIPMRLDIDGLSNKSAAHLYGSKDPIAYRKAPCTAVACLKIIQTLYDNNLAGLNVAIVGRSMRVGRPLAELLLQQDCTVTLYHTKSRKDNFYDKDVLISAIGQPKYFNSWNVDIQDMSIIDVGINYDPQGRMCGDVDYDNLKDLANYITPVPNGVGAVTNTVLFAKLYANKLDFAGIDV
jgi:methylenetetrahydrofolate dehydrogenase (NADP+)/methenyltetrahydrofolate cyclohydrolase